MTPNLVAPCIVTLILALPLSAASRSFGDRDEAAIGGASERLRTHALSIAVVSACPACTLMSVHREMLSADLAHYRIRVRVGSGAYDFIDVHQVVRESAPWVPARTGDALLALPGGLTDFTLTYLADETLVGAPVRHSLATFLAGNDVDVWGLTQSWSLVPAGPPIWPS